MSGRTLGTHFDDDWSRVAIGLHRRRFWTSVAIGLSITVARHRREHRGSREHPVINWLGRRLRMQWLVPWSE